MNAGKERAKGAVQRALELQLFGKFATKEKVISVAQTASVILNNNPERIGYVMVNKGGVKITFATNQDLAVGEGFVLVQEGDTVTVNYIEDAQFPTSELSAIASASGGELFIIEFIRVNL